VHIPDGYLGPVTSGFFYVVMLPIWGFASKIVKKTLKAKQVPLLAIGAAFSFLVMMFDVPVPGGTTCHAVGGPLIAILLGPWAACISVTVVLIVQALLFGDGGIIALGTNCFNLAFVMPFVGYYIYALLSGNSAPDSKKRVLSAAVAGYIAINIAAFMVGLELGIQPILHHTAFGQPLNINATNFYRERQIQFGLRLRF